MVEISREPFHFFVIGHLHLQILLIIVEALRLLEHPIKFLETLLQKQNSLTDHSRLIQIIPDNLIVKMLDLLDK